MNNQVKEWLKKHKAVVIWLLALLPVWLVVGLVPLWLKGWNGQEAGVFGDSFGFVNSLFSGFAFLIATYALIKQIEESHESGQIQKQTAQLQLEQTAIAERTAMIQESIRKDSLKQIAMSAFLKIAYDVRLFKDAFIERHFNEEEPYSFGPPEHGMGDRNFSRVREFDSAYRLLQSNCLGIRLIFGSAGQLLEGHLNDLLELSRIMTETQQTSEQSKITLGIAVQEIEEEMVRLWHTLRPEPLPHEFVPDAFKAS